MSEHQKGLEPQYQFRASTRARRTAIAAYLAGPLLVTGAFVGSVVSAHSELATAHASQSYQRDAIEALTGNKPMTGPNSIIRTSYETGASIQALKPNQVKARHLWYEAATGLCKTDFNQPACSSANEVLSSNELSPTAMTKAYDTVNTGITIFDDLNGWVIGTGVGAFLLGGSALKKIAERDNELDAIPSSNL